MKRVTVGVAVIVGALGAVTPPAASQNSSAWLTPRSPEALESAGEVVITVSMWRAGRVMYRTFDGRCTVGYPSAGVPANATCRDDQQAASPEDYSAVSGELVFAAGGTKSITIPIVDDEVADGDEWFTVAAWEDANADPWLGRGDDVVVSIVDDEADTGGGSSAPSAVGPSPSTNSTVRAAGTSASPVPAGGMTPSSAGGAGGPPAPNALGAGMAIVPVATTTTTENLPSPELEVALPNGEVRPGPGFEITNVGVPDPVAERGGGAGASVSALAIGAGIAAFGAGFLALVRRRRRWSPTQP